MKRIVQSLRFNAQGKTAQTLIGNFQTILPSRFRVSSFYPPLTFPFHLPSQQAFSLSACATSAKILHLGEYVECTNRFLIFLNKEAA